MSDTLHFLTKVDAFKIRAWFMVILEERETLLHYLDPVMIHILL